MNWLYYLAEANIYLGVFYLAYCLFLSKETHYLLNRAYLLCSCIVSFVLPVVQIGILKPVDHITHFVPKVPINEHRSDFQYVVLCIYLLGIVVLTIKLLIKLLQLKKLTKGRVLHHQQYKLIYLDESNTAFSFFKYLFIGTNTVETNMIIRHELVHIQQKHSLDIIFMELFKIVNWFSPVVYFIINSIKSVHEYTADKNAAAHEPDKLTYSAFLLNNAYGLSGSPITHSFFNYNLLKRRIIMLNKKRSGNLARLKYLLALPLCIGMLCESTVGFSKTYGLINIGPEKETSSASADTVKKKVPPPPPPVPPGRHKLPPPPPQPPKKKKLPPPVVIKDQVKLPPHGVIKDQVKLPPNGGKRGKIKSTPVVEKDDRVPLDPPVQKKTDAPVQQ